MNKPFATFDRACLMPFLMMAAGVFLASTIVGCGMQNRLTRIVEEFPRATACEHCHIEVFNEWSASSHAKAYTSIPFREATDGYRFAACLGCHTPEPALVSGAPVARTVYQDEGVTCVSCHLEEGKLSGPISSTGMISPHPVEVNSDQYRDSNFCGRCHEGTFAEWNGVEMEDKPSCQQCHMPPKKRKMTQATGMLSKIFVAFEEDVLQKRHTFAAVPEELESTPYSVKITHYAETVTLTVMNHLPHSLPSGDFGVRIIALKVSIVNSKGEVIPIGERELVMELGTAIPPQSLLEWKLAISTDARSIHVRMIRIGHEGIGTKVLIETEFPLL